MAYTRDTTLNTRNMVTSNLAKPISTVATPTSPTYRPPTYVAPKPVAPVAPVRTANDLAYINSLATSGTAGQQAWAKANGGVATVAPTTFKETPAPLPTETPMPTETQSGGGTINSGEQISALKDAQIQAAIAALSKARDSSLMTLDNEKAGLGQTYYDQRNQAAANSDVSAMNFAQRAASRGIQGNAASMPEIYRQSSLQGQIGALNQQEAGRNAGIESNRTNILNGYQNDLVSAQAGAESQYLQNYIDQMNLDRQFGLQEAGVTGQYNGEITMQGQDQINQNALSELSIVAKQIENSYLPATLKLEAEQLAQQVANGRIDAQTALAKLNQIKTGGTTGGSSYTPKADVSNLTFTKFNKSPTNAERVSYDAFASDIQALLRSGATQDAQDLFAQNRVAINNEFGDLGTSKIEAMIQNARYYQVQ